MAPTKHHSGFVSDFSYLRGIVSDFPYLRGLWPQLSIFLDSETLKVLSSNSFFEKSSISRCLTERCLTFGIYCNTVGEVGLSSSTLPYSHTVIQYHTNTVYTVPQYPAGTIY